MLSSGSDSADISYGEPTLSRELLEAFAESFDLAAIDALAAPSR